MFKGVCDSYTTENQITFFGEKYIWGKNSSQNVHIFPDNVFGKATVPCHYYGE